MSDKINIELNPYLVGFYYNIQRRIGSGLFRQICTGQILTTKIIRIVNVLIVR